MQELANPSLVGIKAVNQVDAEAVHAIRDDAHAVQKVADQSGLEDVQFELTAHAAHGSGNVVTHNLRADHGESLALGRVHLARHDRGTRLVLREVQLGKTAAGTRAEETDVLSNLKERASEGVQGARGLDDGVVGGENFELVGRGNELGAGDLADLRSHGRVEALEGVETGTDSCTTLSKLAEVREGGLDALNVAVQLSDVARELLTKRQGCGVLQVGTTDLDDMSESVHLGLESVTQVPQRRQKVVLEVQNSGNVHDCREGVVGGGGAVNVVVGVDGLLGAHLSTEDLNCSVRDDLVGVHVGLSARAGLPDDEREVVHQLAFRDLGSSLLDGLGDLRV